jgi:hypothetical protein
MHIGTFTTPFSSRRSQSDTQSISTNMADILAGWLESCLIYPLNLTKRTLRRTFHSQSRGYGPSQYRDVQWRNPIMHEYEAVLIVSPLREHRWGSFSAEHGLCKMRARTGASMKSRMWLTLLKKKVRNAHYLTQLDRNNGHLTPAVWWQLATRRDEMKAIGSRHTRNTSLWCINVTQTQPMLESFSTVDTKDPLFVGRNAKKSK